MILEQQSKKELNRLDSIYAELGFGDAPFVTGKRDLDLLQGGRDDGRRTPVAGGCGKVSYSSKGSASRIARYRMNSGASRLRTYFCPECKTWHLTHSIERKVGDRERHGNPIQRHAEIA